MRILLATDNYPPYIGGAQIQSRLIARELHARGHDVVVAAVWQDGMPAIEDDDGIPVYRLRQLRTLPLLVRKRKQHYQPPFPDPVTVVGLRRLITRFRPDVVHSYGWFSYSCALALLGTDIPLLLTARDYAYSCAKRTLVYHGRICTGPELLKCLGCASEYYGRPKGWVATAGVYLNRPLLRRKVRGLHSISAYVQEVVRRDFLDDRATNGRGVRHDVIASMREQEDEVDEATLACLDQLPGEPFMLFVGALRRVKGVEQLITAYECLDDPPPLVLIGTLEHDTPPIEPPPGVHVLTDFPHAAVMAAWGRCLFAVLPSILPEPFGSVVGEAMSRGKAVIGTEPGGHTDVIVDGETGFLVPAGDVAALAAAIQRLIDDPELRERMGTAGRLRSHSFTAEAVIPQVVKLYDGLAGDRLGAYAVDDRPTPATRSQATLGTRRFRLGQVELPRLKPGVRPLRIMLATDNYPPHIGGAQIQSRLIARELHARGHDVVVAAVWQDGMPAIEDDDGIPVYRLRQLRTLPLLARKRKQHYQPPFPDPVTVVGLRRLITRFRPDVVHSYGWLSYSCALALLGTDIPLLLTARDYAYSCAKRTLVYHGRICTGPELLKCLGCASEYYGRPKGWVATAGVYLNRPLLRRKVRGLHSISAYVQEVVRRDFLDDRVWNGPTFILHDVIASMREQEDEVDEATLACLDQLPGEPFMLFVGALRRVKGVEQLITAYECLDDPPPLVLIGTLEHDTPPIEPPPKVHVLTDFPHAAVMAAWGRCLFAVLPSILPEPFGSVVGEAMSRGKAVIGTEPGGHTDVIVDGETGFLVPAGDVAALAAAIQRLIDDPELRERMGTAGRLRSHSFTAEKAIMRLEQLYDNVQTSERVRP